MALSSSGCVNINLGTSRNPDVEAEILKDVGSYGRQLGRIGDALDVLLKHFRPDAPLDPAERNGQDRRPQKGHMLAEIARSRRSADQPSGHGAAKVIRQHAGNHGLADRHGPDADAWVMAALGDDLDRVAYLSMERVGVRIDDSA